MWRKLFRRIETKNTNTSRRAKCADSSLLLLNQYSASSPSAALSLYETSTAVSIPINKIISQFKSLKPILEVDDNVETKHEVLDLLNNPNIFFDRDLFFESLGINYEVTGEACIVAVGNINDAPVELHSVSPSNIDIRLQSGIPVAVNITGELLQGTYVLQDGRYVRDEVTELLFIRSFSRRDNSYNRGGSKLISAINEVTQHILGTTHNVALLTNGAKVSLLFHFKQDMDQDTFEETKRRIEEAYVGADNAGSVKVTAGEDLDIKELGVTNRDMDFANLHELARNAVAMQFNIPLPLVNLSAETHSNYESAIIALYDDCVLPLADKLFGALSRFLLPRFGLDTSKAKITYNPLQIPALRKRMLEEINLRRKIGAETDNELRQLMGRESYDGGDTVYKPANLLPIGEDELPPDDDEDPFLNE